jgi:hypothetical protein
MNIGDKVQIIKREKNNLTGSEIWYKSRGNYGVGQNWYNNWILG